MKTIDIKKYRGYLVFIHNNFLVCVPYRGNAYPYYEGQCGKPKPMPYKEKIDPSKEWGAFFLEDVINFDDIDEQFLNALMNDDDFHCLSISERKYIGNILKRIRLVEIKEL